MNLAKIARSSMAVTVGVCALWTIRAAAQTPHESAIARVNGIKEETGGSHRYFLPVVSGPIIIYDKKTKAFTTYLDFNGHGENRGLFKKFFTLSGFGNGINGFNLDPDYAKNG